MKRLLALALILQLSASLAWAQGSPGGAEYAPNKSGPREQLAVTIFAGLGGAILGLSTLSFYDRPQDHLANIALGFAIGIIGGTVVSTYQLATRPYSVWELHKELDQNPKTAKLLAAGEPIGEFDLFNFEF